MDISSLDIESLRELAGAIHAVLDSRLHRRVHLGEEILVKGSLSRALHLPEIRKRLNAVNEARQQQAVNELTRLWQTLSETTRQTVIERLEWYEPDQLDWDDPRSNRKPFYSSPKP